MSAIACYCSRCHRPMKNPSVDGLGPVCRKTVRPSPQVDRDLFGYDIEKACEAARESIGRLIESRAAKAHIALRHGFRDLRRKAGVWA